jgi:membrane AbrB-like protein
MELLIKLALTLAAGLITGLIFVLLKIPNGLRIGSLLGASLLGIFFNAAWMPSQTQYVVQVIAGALIGCTMEKSDLKRLPWIIKPTAIMVVTFLCLNLIIGVLIRATSPLDWITALMCGVPGGITDIPIIASDMGADTPKVALAQLARYILGVTAFPPMILAFDNYMTRRAGTLTHGSKEQGGEAPQMERVKSKVQSPAALACTLAAGSAAGFVGYLTGIPAGALLFSVIAVFILKLKFDFAYISPMVKKIALLVSGCYIGSFVTMDDVRGFKSLALPIIITLGGYIANSFITGKILSKACGFSRKEGMLATTPAGVSDIALNSAEIGVINTDIIVMQVVRALIAVAFFPQIINALLLVLP